MLKWITWVGGRRRIYLRRRRVTLISQKTPVEKCLRYYLGEGFRRSMSHWKEYYIAKSINDALQVLDSGTGQNRLIAGGTDLLLDIQQGRHTPVDTLVDISRVPEMEEIEIRGGELYIGASASLNKVIASQNVQYHAQSLVEAASLIGGPQVRNTATLGGNVAHALPAGDGTVALLALGAQVEIASIDGKRRENLEEIFLGVGKTNLNSQGELLVGFYISLKGELEGSAFRRVMRPQGVAIAILNLAVWLKRDGDHIKEIRIAAGPSGPKPHRLTEVESELTGSIMNESTFQNAYTAFLSEATFRTSRHRATEDYRRHLAGILLRDTLEDAWHRSQADPKK